MNEAISRTDGFRPWWAGLLRACYAAALFCVVLNLETRAAWVEGHWTQVWVDGETQWTWVDGYWEDNWVDGYSEDQWVDGYWETQTVDGYWETQTVEGYWDNQWSDGYWEDQWVDGYSEDQWVDGYWEEQWVDGYYDDDGNWNDGYTDWAWVDGYWETVSVEGYWESVWTDGSWSEVWVDGYTEDVWVDGYTEDVWVDGYWETVTVEGHWESSWVEEHWEEVTIPGYYEDVWVDGYWDPPLPEDIVEYSDWLPDCMEYEQGHVFLQSQGTTTWHHNGSDWEITSFTLASREQEGCRPPDTIEYSEWLPPCSDYFEDEVFLQSQGTAVWRHNGEYWEIISSTIESREQTGCTPRPPVNGGTGGTGGTGGVKQDQTITFAAIDNQGLNSPSFTLSVTSSSGLPVSLGIITGAVTLNGTTVTVLGAGEVTIRASQAGDASYNPAPDVDRSFTVFGTAPVATAATHVTSRTFLANWSPVPGATAYRLDVARDPSFSNFVLNNWEVVYFVDQQPVAGTAYTVTGLIFDSEYYYRVRAVSSNGTSANSNTITVTTSGLASSEGVPSFWFHKPRDVKENGEWTKVYDDIYDEVIPIGGTHGLTTYIAEWWSTGASVTFYDEPVNDWWSYRDFSFDTDGDGLGDYSEPNFNAWWRSGITFYYPGEIYFRLGAEFTPVGAGYDYEICYSTDSILTPNSLSVVNGGGHLHSENNLRQTLMLFHPFTEQQLDGGSLYLVRYGLALGATRMSLPGGGSIDIDVTAGVAGVTFPGGTSIQIGATGVGTISFPGGKSVSVDVATGAVNVSGWPGTTSVPSNGSVTLPGTNINVSSTSRGASIEMPGVATIHANQGGGGSIEFPGGAVVTIDGHGKIDVKLPPGTNSLLAAAVDLANVVLQQGAGVVWSVRNILTGVVTLPSTGPLGVVDLGVTAAGVYQLGVKLGDGPTIWFATVNQPQIAVDANRDGQVLFDQSDGTTSAAPYRFWVNDDDDGDQLRGEQEFENTSAGYEFNRNFGIRSRRDLEDFARLWINCSGIADALKSGDLQIALQWKANTASEPNILTGAPAINLYRHYESDGSTRYLTDDTTASQQITSPFSTVLVDAGNKNVISSTNGVFIFKKELFANLSSSQTKTFLLFEGAGIGKGQLQLLLLDKNGNQIGEGTGVWLDIRRINTMFERVKATTQYALSSDGIDATMPLPHDYIEPAQVPQPTLGWTADDRGEAFVPDPSEDLQNKNYIVFVHGWRQAPGIPPAGVSSSLTYVRTMFKRLWHAGYKGRFAAFRWPTFYSGPELDDQNFINGILTYNDSEYRAWKAGQSLAQYVNQLPSDYKRRVAAHSMGNIVAGSAFKYGMAADSYAMLNAAVPAICYEETALRRWPTFTGIYGWLTGLPGYSIPSQSPNAPNSKTPVDDVDSSIRARSYLRQLDTISATVVNFYLEADFATSISWNANNVIMRPHGGYAYAWGHTDPGERLILYDSSTPPIHRHPSDPHEVMAYDCKVPTFTVNATGGTGGSIINRVNMQTYGFDREHSAQWQWRFQQTAQFYQRLLVEFGLTPAL